MIPIENTTRPNLIRKKLLSIGVCQDDHTVSFIPTSQTKFMEMFSLL